jgi:putative transposase
MSFHVLNRAAKRAVLFESTADYAAFEDAIDEAVARHAVAIFAYCIMPNHWHFVLSPKRGHALSRFMHWLTTTHARRWQDARGLTGLGAVYQGRFKAIPIRDDYHFLRVCRYVERNPLRASLVTRAEEWRWSSLRQERPAWLMDWPVPRPDGWTAEVNTPQTCGELEAIRHAIRNGLPFGDEQWRANILTLHRGAAPRPRGRPPRHPSATVLHK